MKDKFNLFYTWVINQGVEISDKTNPYQCMDLMYAWTFFLNIPKSSVQHLYAYQVFTEPNDLTRKHFEIIQNTPEFVPQAGDIAVFDKTSTNIAGHVSVCDGSGDQTKFSSLDQNWAGNSRASIVVHNYDNPKLLGVLRPRVIEVKPEINDQTKIYINPEYATLEVQQIRSLLIAKDSRIFQLEVSEAYLKKRVEELSIPVPEKPTIFQMIVEKIRQILAR